MVLGVFLYNALLHQVNIAIRGCYKVISIHHQKILEPKDELWNNKPSLTEHTVHYFSSCVLTEEEISVLAYGLDHQITTNINENAIFKEFEQFVKNFLRDKSHIPKN